eukprot:TRINITY_DN6422_c0_g1_i1.p1 TRINITY_DN6422_c0_g1~~TRINITY_DN6422_c0_g1_i1.p1  ORF type:complete len:345 (-),score=88.14 TRINITY_DN6422_c0_g1_i1:46-1041(-)
MGKRQREEKEKKSEQPAVLDDPDVNPRKKRRAEQRAAAKARDAAFAQLLAEGEAEESGEQADTEVFIRRCTESDTDAIRKHYDRVLAPDSVLDVNWVYRGDRFLGCGFISFVTAKLAKQALTVEAPFVAGMPTHVVAKEERQNRTDRKECTLFVGNLPPETKEAEIAELFPGCERVYLVRKRNVFSSTAFVLFSSAKQAEKAAGLKDLELGDRTLEVRLATKQPQREDERKAFMYHCPPDIRDEDVNAAFSNVVSVKWLMKADRFTGQAFVVFATAEDAQKAARKGSFELHGDQVFIRLTKEAQQAADGGGHTKAKPKDQDAEPLEDFEVV